MTTEESFHLALDETPDSWQARLVFADWLLERDEPRAEGYRALGVQRVRPVRLQMAGDDGQPSGNWVFIYGTRANESEKASETYAACYLRDDWFSQLPAVHKDDTTRWWRYFETRRAAEEAAVAAFALLPDEHRSELLAAPLDPIAPTDTERTE